MMKILLLYFFSSKEQKAFFSLAILLCTSLRLKFHFFYRLGKRCFLAAQRLKSSPIDLCPSQPACGSDNQKLLFGGWGRFLSIDLDFVFPRTFISLLHLKCQQDDCTETDRKQTCFIEAKCVFLFWCSSKW